MAQPENRTGEKVYQKQFEDTSYHIPNIFKQRDSKSFKYTHLKIVFGEIPKTILPEYSPRRLLSGDNCNQDLVFKKPKTKPVLVYLPTNCREAPYQY